MMDLFGRVDNLFDRNYVGSVIVNESNNRYYEPAPERNYGVGLSVAYQLINLHRRQQKARPSCAGLFYLFRPLKGGPALFGERRCTSRWRGKRAFTA